MIVEKITGKPLRDAIKERIFAPVHMTHTYFYSDELRGAPLPKTHRTRGYLIDTQDIRSAITLNRMFPKVGSRPEGDVYDTTLAAERDDAAGGIIATLPDLLHYADAVFHGRLISKSSQVVLTAVTQGMEETAFGKHRTWAMQAVHEPYGIVLYKEGDGEGGNTCLMSYVVAADEIFVGCTNSVGYFDEVDFMLDKVIPATLSRKSI
jgi:CubicO group peptidase (beta-lactamase class C family)